MNSKTIAVIVAAVIIIGGGIWYSSSKSGSTGTNSDTASSTEQTQTTGSATSIGAAIASGQEYRCTYMSKDANQESSGTFYIKSKAIRADITTKIVAQNATIDSHMIIDSQNSYTWSSALANGIKIALPANAWEANGALAQSLSVTQANVALNYNCAPSSVEASLFVLPANVTFMAPQQ